MKATTKLPAAQRSLLHNLCTSQNGTGVWDSRQRATLLAMERQGLVTVVAGYFPTDKYTGKSGSSYTATVTAAGRAAFAQES